MMRFGKRVLATGLIAFSAAQSSQAAVLSYYNFNDSTPGTGSALGVADLNPDAPAAAGSLSAANLTGTNGGTANNNYGTFTGSTTNALNSDVAGQALAIVGSGNNAKFIDFTVPTTGLSILSMSFAAQRTATGFSNDSISYSVDGTNFLPVTTFNPPTSFGPVSAQIVNGTPLPASTIVRLTVDGATSTSGNIRLDNVQFADTVVPEPGSMLLVGGLALAGLASRRRPRRV
jgi:hypothetical protein